MTHEEYKIVFNKLAKIDKKTMKLLAITFAEDEELSGSIDEILVAIEKTFNILDTKLLKSIE